MTSTVGAFGCRVKRYQDITDPSLAKALAHPLRTRILASLENRTASPSEIAEELDAPLGVVSYHVRRLYALHFLRLVKRVPRRGALEHYYTTIAGPRITDAAWEATPTIVKQAMIRAALAEIGANVAAAAEAGGFEQGDAHLSRNPVSLDAQGWKEVARELDRLTSRIAKIEAESHERLALADAADKQEATVVLMMFNSPPRRRVGQTEPPAPESREVSGRRSRRDGRRRVG